MGTFRQKVRISSPADETLSREIEMVVDSGATYTQVPAPLLLALKIARRSKRRLRIATGEVIERDAGEIRVTLDGEMLATPVIFRDGASEPLLGAVTLEEFGLAIDPVNKMLVPVPELMLGSLFGSTEDRLDEAHQP